MENYWFVRVSVADWSFRRIEGWMSLSIDVDVEDLKLFVNSKDFSLQILVKTS